MTTLKEVMNDMIEEKSKIMVVDDDHEIREVISVLLSNEDFDIIEAESGEEALKLLAANIDLIILDVMMPGMSGYQVSRMIRERSNVPILFLTARTQNSDLVLGYSSGGDDYLAKPFSYPELIARVKGLLRRYTVEMSRNVQSGNTQNLKSMVIQRSFPKWSVAERRKTAAAPVRLPAAPASTPGTSQAAAQAGCVYRP